MRHAVWHACAVAVLVFAGGLASLSDRGPSDDEFYYLAHAYSLYSNATFARATPEQPAPPPGARVAPLLPAIISVLMHADASLARGVECATLRTCAPGEQGSFRTIKVFNLAWLALAMAMLWWLLAGATRPATAWACIVLMVLSQIPWIYADYFLTEGIYAPLAWLSCACFALAWYRKSARFAVLAAVLLAAAALTRPTLFYLFILILPLVVLLQLWPRRQRDLRWIAKHVLCLVIPFAIVTGPWLARNHMLFDRASITAGYSAYPLSSRVSYNAMTGREYRAGWVYWLPDFGDSLARALFPPEDYTRLDFGNPDGFIGTQLVPLRVEMARQPDPTRWLIRDKVLGDWVTHFEITLLLAWRGAFVGKYFGLAGAAFMLFALLRLRPPTLRTFYRWVALPPVVLLFFQAAISVSITRYNIALVLPMALAMALVLTTSSDRRMQRFAPLRHTRRNTSSEPPHALRHGPRRAHLP